MPEFIVTRTTVEEQRREAADDEEAFRDARAHEDDWHLRNGEQPRYEVEPVAEPHAVVTDEQHLMAEHGLTENYVGYLTAEGVQQEHRHQHERDKAAGIASHTHEGM
jgi:hypothetical protein